jgi:hypothetical protein
MATIQEILAAKKAAAKALAQPGKPKALVLSANAPKEKPKAPAPDYYEERSLAVPEGQSIDMTPIEAQPAMTMWHEALNAFESELAITNDPKDPMHAWIAVFPSGLTAPPILLQRLQYIEHPQTIRPANHPF